MVKKSTRATTVTYLLSLVAAIVLVAGNALAAPPSYIQTIVAQDVVAKYIRGEIRFCESHNLHGMVCRRNGVVQDWWSAQTYAEAFSGRRNVTVLEVSVSPDGIYIRFQ